MQCKHCFKREQVLGEADWWIACCALTAMPVVDHWSQKGRRTSQLTTPVRSVWFSSAAWWAERDAALRNQDAVGQHLMEVDSRKAPLRRTPEGPGSISFHTDCVRCVEIYFFRDLHEGKQCHFGCSDTMPPCRLSCFACTVLVCPLAEPCRQICTSEHTRRRTHGGSCPDLHGVVIVGAEGHFVSGAGVVSRLEHEKHVRIVTRLEHVVEPRE